MGGQLTRSDVRERLGVLVHSRKGFSQQRGRDPESVGQHRVNDRPQGRQSAGAASLNEDADRAANNEAANINSESVLVTTWPSLAEMLVRVYRDWLLATDHRQQVAI